MRICECEDGFLEAARREGEAARRDAWMALLVVVFWSMVVAAVVAQLGGAS